MGQRAPCPDRLTHTHTHAHARQSPPLPPPLARKDLEDLEESIRSVNPEMDGFDSSCFSGSYVTPDIDEAYLTELESSKQQERPKMSGKTGAANGAVNGAAAAGGPPAASAAAEDAGECEALHNPKRAKIEDPAHLA